MTTYEQLRPWLFRLEPEAAHRWTLRLLSWVGAAPPVRRWVRRRYSVQDDRLKVKAFGLEFPNPLGLAAGYDKSAAACRGLACLGFGHLELGTVTPSPQAGNPKPRLFRLEADEALINRLGFPNDGASAVRRRLMRYRPSRTILGVNLGKGAGTPLEDAAQDYIALLRTFYHLADYLVINISSPNTIGLRRLQARDALENLLGEMVSARMEQIAASGRRVPMLVKLAPDLEGEPLEDAVGAVMGSGLDGLIATNTTLLRESLVSQYAAETGGLSGRPLARLATQRVRQIHRLAQGRLPIIAVGGIFGPQDAREKLDAGATLLQVYTGLVYRGPSLVREILEDLSGG